MPATWTWVIVGLVAVPVLLYGFSKTAMPVAGVLAGPVLAVVLGPTVATGFMVPLLILGDLFGLFYFRQHGDWRLIRRLVPGVLLGFLLTAVLFKLLDTHTLGRIIGLLILASVALEVWRQRTESIDDELEPMTNKAAIVFFGTLAGMTTMAANAGGTAMTLYLVKMRVSMLAFMGTATWFFFIINLLKVPIIGGLGFITRETLMADLFFAPLIVIGAFIGIFTFRRMNERLFVSIALSLSTVAALWLIIHG
ncbi:MAG: sulfite exporter TauE/SafE family protein [Actinomycetes bacterium]